MIVSVHKITILIEILVYVCQVYLDVYVLTHSFTAAVSFDFVCNTLPLQGISLTFDDLVHSNRVYVYLHPVTKSLRLIMTTLYQIQSSH